MKLALTIVLLWQQHRTRVPTVYIKDGDAYNLDAERPNRNRLRKNFPGEPTGENSPHLLKMKGDPQTQQNDCKRRTTNWPHEGWATKRKVGRRKYGG